METMRILVTGGTGFIGSNIALELLKQGHEIIITGTKTGEQKLLELEDSIIEGHLNDIDWKRAGIFDLLFHEAAINDTTFLDEKEMFRANVEPAKKLFPYTLSAGCKAIVFASSTAVYGDVTVPFRENGPVHPLNPYAESKLALEEYAMDFARKNKGMNIVGLRYCNVFGPRENHKGKRATMIYQLAQQMRKGNPKLFKFGEQKRDYIYVKDVVRANLLAAKSKKTGIFNCGSGKPTSFNRLVEILNGVLGTNRVPEYIGNPYTSAYQAHTECDMSFTKKKLGFVPEYDIEKGILDYYKSGFL